MSRPFILDATTKEYTGNTVFKPDPNRAYFFITFTSGAGTVRFGNDGGEIPLVAGGHYNPPISPNTEITVTTGDTFVVHTNIHA